MSVRPEVGQPLNTRSAYVARCQCGSVRSSDATVSVVEGRQNGCRERSERIHGQPDPDDPSNAGRSGSLRRVCAAREAGSHLEADEGSGRRDDGKTFERAK